MTLLLKGLEQLVEPRRLVEAIREAYLSERVVPPRAVVRAGDLWASAMIAWSATAGLGAKVVGIFPRGTPRIRAIGIYVDWETGELLALVDGVELTAWRTAAATALALEVMGAPRGATLMVIGAGVQARHHAKLLKQLLEPSRVLVHSRTRARAEELAAEIGGEAVDLVEGLAKADIVVAATDSRTPVILGEHVRSGAYVASVGAPRPVREVDEAFKARARCALVDTVNAVEESDDVVGVEVVELGEALRGASCKWGDVKYYKSVGTAILDVAAMAYFYRRARETGWSRVAEL